jgi:hypothetical protein
MEPGIIREIYIYGNGIVEYLCRTHHVFVVLRTTENEIIEKEKFILLEVKKSRGRIIKIRIETDSSLKDVINRRLNMIDRAKFWSREMVHAPTLDVQQVIDSFQGRQYSLIFNDCRRFVDAVCKKCNAQIRAKDGCW